MSNSENEEDSTGLDYCGGLKERGEGPVMGTDLLFQTGGASKSAQDTALLATAYYQNSFHT